MYLFTTHPTPRYVWCGVIKISCRWHVCFFPCSDFKTPSRHSFHRLLISKQSCDTLFAHFQNHLALATLFSPAFDFKTPPRHSFHPFSKPIGVCETLFTAFQFQNALATLFSPPFKSIWDLRHFFQPFSKPIGTFACCDRRCQKRPGWSRGAERDYLGCTSAKRPFSYSLWKFIQKPFRMIRK